MVSEADLAASKLTAAYSSVKNMAMIKLKIILALVPCPEGHEFEHRIFEIHSLKVMLQTIYIVQLFC